MSAVGAAPMASAECDTSRRPVLCARGLVVRDSEGRVLVDGIDLAAHAGQCVGVVGESGSGKTLSMRACLGLLPRGLTCTADELSIDQVPIAGIRRKDLARLLGTRVGFVPQNTMEYLQPLIRVRSQIVDGYLTHHRQATRAQALARAVELLAQTGIPDPDRVLHSYPGELSGGMRQRVNIAMALMGEPVLLVADEPTAALDCVVQRQVAELFWHIAHDRGVAVIMVSHSLGMVRRYCDDLVVMYAGHVVERGAARQVFSHPQHAYTQALISALPRVGQPRDERLCEMTGAMAQAAAGEGVRP